MSEVPIEYDHHDRKVTTAQMVTEYMIEVRWRHPKTGPTGWLFFRTAKTASDARQILQYWIKDSVEAGMPIIEGRILTRTVSKYPWSVLETETP